MPLVRATSDDIRSLAHLMVAEAENQGQLGMQMVGRVVVNRVRGNCADFEGLRTIPQVVEQHPGGFEAHYNQKYWWSLSGKIRDKHLRYARDVVWGRANPWPSSFALFFLRARPCPPRFFGAQPIPGDNHYKDHCFYSVPASECPAVYR